MRTVTVVIVIISFCAIAAVCTPQEMRQEIYGVDTNVSSRIPTDFVLIIDKSGSMRIGSRFSEAQQAARNFVELLSARDRAGIVAFDSRAHVYSEFSSSKSHLRQSIDRMRIGDWTQYTEGLLAASRMYDARTSNSNHRRVIVFMSDGRPDDDEQELFEIVDELIAKNHCIYTIAYADDALDEAERILQEIAFRSQQATGCGEYFSAREDSFDLQRSYQSIYAEVSSEEVFDVSVFVDTVDEPRFLLDISAKNTGGALSACFAPSTRLVITQNRRVIKDITTSDNIIITSLTPGEYEYVAFVRETCGGDCLLTGESEGVFVVDSSSVACTPSWNDLSVLLSRTDYTEVQITPAGFFPQTVRTDGVVVWKNTDSVSRQVVAVDGSFSSPVLAPGDTWQYIFPPGSHGYREASGSFSGVLRQEQTITNTPVDIVLVIDNSGSMAGSPMENAKEAAKNFIGLLTSQDRAALVVFDHRAYLVQHLTSDGARISSAIDSIVPQGGTLYVPALRQAGRAIAGSQAEDRIVIFLSDGIPHDLGGLPEILTVVTEEFSDVCLYTIGYAEEGLEAIDTLNRIGEYARSLSGCGSFYYSANDKEDLGRVLGEVYAQSQEPRLEIFDVKVEDVGNGEFVLSARVRSKENGARLPSESQFGCVPVASVRAVFGSQEFTLRYDGEKYAGTVVLPSGTHSGFVTASISGYDSIVDAAFGFSRVEVFVPARSQWYLWLLLSIGIVAIAYIFMHRPIRSQ